MTQATISIDPTASATYLVPRHRRRLLENFVSRNLRASLSYSGWNSHQLHYGSHSLLSCVHSRRFRL